MARFGASLRSSMMVCRLSCWMMLVAVASSEHAADQEEYFHAAKIYASIADANCENDQDKFSNFYSNIRRSIQAQGNFEHYFPDKVFCILDCTTLELYPGSDDVIPFYECCNHSLNHSVLSGSFECRSCHDGYPQFRPLRDRINAAAQTAVTCQGDISYPGIKQEDFTWCIYQRSNDSYDIHGCLNASGIINISSAAAAIKLLDNVWIDTKTHAPSNQGIISIINYNGLFDQALFTCSVNNQHMSAIQFMEMDLYDEAKVFYAGSSLPSIPQVVRVGDVIENFQCAFSTRRTVWINYSWIHKDNPSIFECTENCDIPLAVRNTSQNTSHVEYHVTARILSESSCQFKLSDEYLLMVVLLNIHGITLNDVGEYYCQAAYILNDGQLVPIIKSRVEKITIVMYEFPEEEAKTFAIGTNDSIVCGVKTFSSASVAWWFETETLVPFVGEGKTFGKGSGEAQCSGQSDVFATHNITEQENGFSLFHMTLHFCNLSSWQLGRYSCIIDDESFDDNIRNTTFSITLLGNATTVSPDTESLSLVIIYCIAGGMCLFLLVVVVVTTVLFAMFKKLSDQRAYYRKCSLISMSSTDSKLFFMFKQAASDSSVYPHDRLDYVEELGEGRFGRVYKACAQDITPEAPGKSLVAVKTTKDTNVTQAVELWQELQLMKGIEPHPHVCNMIAYSISPEGMPNIIVEYAAHGNLKNVLVQCRMALLKAGKNVRLLSDMESRVHFRTESTVGGKQDKDRPKAMLLFSPKEALVDGVPVQNYALLPQAILESDVYRMASQVVAGLLHLESQKILHRDISARNILVAKGFTIKISDFGFARDVSQTEYYRKMADGLIPIKWVALEGLEKQIYTSKGDVWSFGVLLWEIASYGIVPYHDINISDDWEYFLKLLRSGYRLPQPAGCSNRLYNVMSRCWNQEPEKRPSFLDLSNSFRDLLKPSMPQVNRRLCQETVI